MHTKLHGDHLHTGIHVSETPILTPRALSLVPASCFHLAFPHPFRPSFDRAFSSHLSRKKCFRPVDTNPSYRAIRAPTTDSPCPPFPPGIPCPPHLSRRSFSLSSVQDRDKRPKETGPVVSVKGRRVMSICRMEPWCDLRPSMSAGRRGMQKG